MTNLPGKQRGYQQHLRYKHMVSRLQGMKAPQLENAIAQELAKGKRWRIDAAFEAAQGKWSRLSLPRVAADIGRFGRLTAAERFNAVLDAQPELQKNQHQLNSMMLAMALYHEHFRVAERAVARGASIHAVQSADRLVNGIVGARDARKVDILRRSKCTFEAALIQLSRNNDADGLRWLIDAAQIAPPALGLLLSRTTHVRPAPVAVVELLAEKGARLGNGSGDYALRDALHSGNAAMAVALYKAGVEPKASHLDMACAKGLQDIAAQLVGKGIKPTTDTLKHARACGNADVVKLCIDNGAEKNVAPQKPQPTMSTGRPANLDQLMGEAIKEVAAQTGGEIERMKGSGNEAEAATARLLENMLHMVVGRLEAPAPQAKKPQGKKAGQKQGKPANKNIKRAPKPPKAG